MTSMDRPIRLVDDLATELQLRIGLLPIVKAHAFHLPSHPGKIVRLLLTQPQSYSEISRVVRAARSLKLNVRGCGHMSGGELDLYGNSSTVLIDCSSLADSKRIELVQVQRTGQMSPYSGVRVLAGVGVDELSSFLMSRSIELKQQVDGYSRRGTVVGAVVTGAPGLIDIAGYPEGACLADEVLLIRIVDCHGDLKEYSSDEQLAAVTANLGLIGIVYDVVLRYRPQTLSRVTIAFKKWSELVSNSSELLQQMISENMMTQLIYLPFNSSPNLRLKSPKSCDLGSWDPMQDEVLVRTIRREVGDLDKVDPSCHSSTPLARLHLLHPNFGPEPGQLVRATNFTTDDYAPKSGTAALLAEAHQNLRRSYKPDGVVAEGGADWSALQFTEWAVHAMTKIDRPFRSLAFTMESDRKLSSFEYAMQTILGMFKKLGVEKANFSFNLGLRIEFTGGTRVNNLLGLGTYCLGEPAVEDFSLVHFTFSGLLAPGQTNLWKDAATLATQTMMQKVPRCTVQWKSEWYLMEKICKRLRSNSSTKTVGLRQAMSIADRDGVFLTKALTTIVCPEATEYQKKYRGERSEVLKVFSLADSSPQAKRDTPYVVPSAEV